MGIWAVPFLCRQLLHNGDYERIAGVSEAAAIGSAA